MLLQDPGAGAQLSASQSGSFAFSRADLTPGVHSCPEEPEAGRNAHVHPLGFFAAEGARQLCQVEGNGPATHACCSQPWRIWQQAILEPPTGAVLSSMAST